MGRSIRSPEGKNMSIQSFYINIAWKKNDAKRDAGLTFPKEIKSIKDIRYGLLEVFNSLDIYYPKDRESEKLPVIINVHGGAYVYGSKELYRFYCADLAKRGFAVVNYNYRLAPKYKFPAPLEDLSAVISWLETNGDKYPLDLSKVFLIGDSAGAQIASQYGVIYSNESYRKLFGYEKPDIKIRGLSLACGLYDLRKHLNKKLTGLDKDYFTSRPEEFGDMLKATDYIDKNYPPCYVFSSGGDFLLENLEPMVALLESKGVTCESRIYGDKSTGHVFHVDIKTELAKKANDDQTEFMKKLILGS